jgi:serine protease Do
MPHDESMSRPARRSAAWLAGLFLLVAAPASTQENLPALAPDFEALAKSVRPSVFAVLAQRQVNEPRVGEPGRPARYEKRWFTRVGSGVAVDEEGGILTTASVVQGVERLSVRSATGTIHEAVLVGEDPVANVALLRVSGLRTRPVALAGSGAMAIGERVLTLGASFRVQPTQAAGVVQVRHRDPRHPLLQITNPVFPGNSGAAALNARGELVGIVQGELGSPDGGLGGDRAERRQAGAGVVLPVETLAPVLVQLRGQGYVRHGFLGLQTRALSVDGDGEQGERVPLGALVENVVPESPAAQGGLRAGDLVVAFEGERVEYPGQLARWVAATAPGASVELVWVRNETRQSGRFALADSPARYARWSQPARPAGAPMAGRIEELERQIRRLTRELEQLKSQTQPR